MSFLHPGFLFLLLALPLVWIWPRGRRDALHIALRTVVLALVIFALARPVSVNARDVEHHVFVVDVSGSSNSLGGANRLASAAGMAGALDDVHRVSLLTFGENALQVPEGVADEFASVQHLASQVDSSPIAEALTLASTQIPEGSAGAITLISDGRATNGRWAPIAEELALRGVPVHALSLPRATGDVYPTRLTAVQALRVGHRARLILDLEGVGAKCTVRLDGPDGELTRRESIAVDGPTSTVLEFEPRAAGFLPVEVIVQVDEGSDARSDNNSFETTLAIDEPRRVLYLGERVQGGSDALSELIGPGFELEVRPGTDLNAEELAGFDLCVLDDMPRKALSENSLTELANAVESTGLGLFASGGKAAFGPGGYHDSPLADILPVEFVQKEEKRDPSTTLVVIIDTSGSMGGNRVQLAKEVARLAIRRLLPHDKVGLVEFYGARRWAAPIQPASNSIEIERALNRLDAGGGTVILPAIEEAFYGLKNVQTRYKHVLILTDGGVETGAFEPLLRRMADDGINTSTVLIGPEAHSEFLVTLSNWGKGRFYSVPNRFNLPEILLKQPSSSKLPAYRSGVHTVEAKGGESWWGEVDPANLPTLAGYVETRERPGAQTLVATVDGAHPILGSWRYGLGRVTAFTTEPTGPGTESWRHWDEFGTWMAQVLERTSSDQREAFRFQLTRDGHALTLTAWRRFEDAGTPSGARLVDGDEQPLAFRQRSPDQFEARFHADPADEVRVIARGQRGTASSQTRLVSRAHADIAAEHQVATADILDLAALASATGGEHRAFTDSAGFLPSAAGASRPRSLRKLWPWFALAALLLYLVELYYRRRSRRVVASS